MCLTCGARARSVVTREADRTQRGRTSGKKRVGVVAAAGRVPVLWWGFADGVDVRSGSSRELVQDRESSRECTSKRGITAAPRAGRCRRWGVQELSVPLGKWGEEMRRGARVSRAWCGYDGVYRSGRRDRRLTLSWALKWGVVSPILVTGRGQAGRGRRCGERRLGWE